MITISIIANRDATDVWSQDLRRIIDIACSLRWLDEGAATSVGRAKPTS
jgi:hypothetical protein